MTTKTRGGLSVGEKTGDRQLGPRANQRSPFLRDGLGLGQSSLSPVFWNGAFLQETEGVGLWSNVEEDYNR